MSSNAKTIQTPGGSTITIGKGSGTTTTPGGATVGGAGRGMVVQGANGQTYVRGSGAVGASNGANRAVAGGSGAGLRTANGETAIAGRGFGAATDGQNTIARAGAGGAVQGRQGTRAGAVGGTLATDGTNVYRSRRAVQAIRGPAGNVVASGRGLATYNGALVSQRHVIAVRNNFTGYRRFYTPGWYARYPRAWVAASIASTAWWSGAYWGSAADYGQCNGDPISYEYGDTLTYDQGVVYAGETPVATAEQYHEQAAEIAAAGETTSDENWLPLGVFAVTSSAEQTTVDKVLQLAVNKEGVVRGNLHDKLTDQVVEVTGSVDKETQRVAFQPADKELPIVECGLFNLTQNALTILIHVDNERVEERTLIRLEDPANSAAGADAGATAAPAAE